MTETPKCPYCGAEMLDDSYTWICPKCRANSPVVIWDEELVKSMTEEELIAYAREAALHRAEPEMRPLTLEEIWEAVDDEDWNFVWLEYNLSSYTLQIIPHHRSKTYFYFLIPGVDEEGRKEPMVEINKEWRCWPRKPTPEQMAAAEWEE